MFKFFKTKKRNNDSELNIDIDNAHAYLVKSHEGRNTGNGEFSYVNIVEHNGFKRLLFRKGNDNNLLYVVLSEEERNNIIRTFHQEMGKNYVYIDSVLSKELGPTVQHRFSVPNSFNTSFTFMNDAGDIWGGHFSID